MSSEFKYFLIFDGIVVLLLLFWIFRKPKRSSLILKMKGGSKPPPKNISGKTSQVPQTVDSFSGGDRSLTVTFNYNGHSFEAYETLGLPAGSSKAAAEEAYKRILPTIDAESREFLTAAIEAIRKSP